MALRRAEFYFAIRDLLVRSEVLGTKLEFDRSGFRVEILFPGNGVDRHWEPLTSLSHVFKKDTHEHGLAVKALKVIVFGEGPRGEDTEGSIEHLRKSFRVAEAVVGEMVEWSRIRGQPWLGLHGQPVRRIGSHLLGDDSVDIGESVFSEDVLPQIEEEHTPEYEIEASLDAANASVLAEHLARNGGALPIAETLLADALYFIGLNPPDWQRAVLISAIACEVKVKDTLRGKVPPDRLPLVDLILENPRDWSIAAVALFDRAMNAALGRSLRAERPEVYKDITKLFEVRNRIAHRGERPGDEDAKRVVLAGRDVFRWLDGL